MGSPYGLGLARGQDKSRPYNLRRGGRVDLPPYDECSPAAVSASVRLMIPLYWRNGTYRDRCSPGPLSRWRHQQIHQGNRQRFRRACNPRTDITILQSRKSEYSACLKRFSSAKTCGRRRITRLGKSAALSLELWRHRFDLLHSPDFIAPISRRPPPHHHGARSQFSFIIRNISPPTAGAIIMVKSASR